MKYSAVILAAAVSFATAQNPTDFFPECAIPGLQSGIAATSCSATDYACQCTTANQGAIQGAAAAAIIAACGSDVAINEVLPAATKFCQAVAAGGSSSTTKASSSAAPSTSAAPTTSAGSSSTTKASSSAASTTKASSTITTKPSAGTAAPSGNGTAPTSTSVPVTAGAALAGSVGTLAMAVLGALAAF